METLSKNFFNIVITALLVVVLLRNCSDSPSGEGPVITRDTTWIIKDSTIHSRPTVIIREGSKDSSVIKQYLPDTNYSKLVAQYNTLLNEYLGRTIQVDSLKIDTIGYVKIQDTVQKNLITGRSYKYNLSYPVITNTITLPAPKVTQVYAGGMLQSADQSIGSISAGLLVKNKKDQILGGSLGLNSNGQLQFGVQSYWKIKLK